MQNKLVKDNKGIYTQTIERWITQSKIDYIRETRRFPKPEDIFAENNEYQKYIVRFIKKMEELRADYCSDKLGFVLIRALHIKAEAKPDDEDMCTICGKKVHGCNVNNPESVNQEDYPVYAEIFAQMVLEAGKVIVKEDKIEAYRELLILRFYTIFSDNLYVKDTAKRQRVRIDREHVIEICFSLGWTSSDCEWVLLRWGDDGFSANDQGAQIYRFLLDAPGAKWTDKNRIEGRIQELSETYQQSYSYINLPQNGTHIAYQSLSSIIKKEDENLTRLKRAMEYADALFERREVFSRCSATARNLLEHILLYSAYNYGWRSILFEDRLPEDILQCEIPPLNEAQQERLINALFSEYSVSDADLFFAPEDKLCFKHLSRHDLLAYPQIGENKELIAVSLRDEFLPLLHGSKPVRKNHILYALFLMHASKRTEVSKTPVDDYHAFVTKANVVLTEAHLQPWYSPHPLEFSIGMSFLSGKHMDDAFRDVTQTFVRLVGNGADNIPTGRNEEKMPAGYGQLKRNLNSSMKIVTPQMMVCLKEKADRYKSVYKELENIANQIFLLWHELGFPAVDIIFKEQSQEVFFCPENERYLPVSLQHRMSAELFGLLFEDDKDGDTLQSFAIPYRNNPVTLSEAAAQYALAEVFLNSPLLSKRLRQGCVLRIIAGYVLDLYGYTALKENAKIIRVANLVGAELNPTDMQNDHDNLDPLETSDSFTMPAIYCDNGRTCRIKLSFMDREDVQKILRWREINVHREGQVASEEDENRQVTSDHLITYSKVCLPDMNEEIEQDNATEQEEQLEQDEEVAILEGWQNETEKSPMEADLEKAEKYTQEIIKDTEPAMQYPYEVHCEEAASYPLLTAEQERELAVRIARGDKNAVTKLAEHNQRLVTFIAKEYCGRGISIMELISAGNVGLCIAAEKFNPDKGRFSTYAMRWIRSLISKEFKNRSQIRIPDKDYSLKKKADRFKEKYLQEHLQMPTEDQIAEALNISAEKLQTVMSRDYSVISYDVPMSDDDENSYRAQIESPNQNSEETDWINFLEKALKDETLHVTPREENVIRLHYGILCGHIKKHYTMNEISKLLNITPEEVRRAEKNFFRRTYNHIP